MFLVKTIANSPLKIVNNRYDAPPIAMIRYLGCRNIPIICYFDFRQFARCHRGGEKRQ